MKTIALLLTLALAGITFAQDPLAPGCHRGQHVYGQWYKQSAMFYIHEQAAHVCKICGSFQNSSGRFMQLVDPKLMPGGQGTLTVEAANQQVDSEILRDFGSMANYQKAPSKDGYGLSLAPGGAR